MRAKKQELGRLKGKVAWRGHPGRDNPVRDFRGSISLRGVTSLIAEIKFASPSAGILRQREDPAGLAGLLEGAGAAALSLVTESRFFGGDLNDLPRVSNAVSIPVLLKDFILDELQVDQAYGHGADAVLLIARILPGDRLAGLIDRCKTLGMSALVEVHDFPELERALAAGAEIIGINNRDLDSFSVDPGTTKRLACRVPDSVTLVSESGIKCSKDVTRLRRFGVHAVLVGTMLMKASDPAAEAGSLARAGGRGEGRCLSRSAV